MANSCPKNKSSSRRLERVDNASFIEDLYGDSDFVYTGLNELKAEFSCGEARGKVKSGLFRCSSFWEDCLAASPFVSSIVNEGYSLPCAQLPPAFFLRNNRSAFRNSEFVGAAILELLEQGLIIEVNSPPHCVNPLSVAEGKKLRLVLDLREVNRYLVKCNFRYEDLRSLAEVFQKGFWFFTWDLKSGYHHVDIFPPHRQFLGFSWSIAGSTRYFCFSVLPFGLSSACYCFTKLLRPLVKRWLSMSHNCFVYLDKGC